MLANAATLKRAAGTNDVGRPLLLLLL